MVFDTSVPETSENETNSKDHVCTSRTHYFDARDENFDPTKVRVYLLPCCLEDSTFGWGPRPTQCNTTLSLGENPPRAFGFSRGSSDRTLAYRDESQRPRLHQPDAPFRRYKQKFRSHGGRRLRHFECDRARCGAAGRVLPRAESLDATPSERGNSGLFLLPRQGEKI